MIHEVKILQVKDMEKRLEAGESAVDLSIEKWDNIIDMLGDCFIMGVSAHNCALCSKHLTHGTCDKGGECPLSAIGERCIKNTDSTYDRYTQKRVEIRKAAIDMRDSLIRARNYEIEQGKEKVKCECCGQEVKDE